MEDIQPEAPESKVARGIAPIKQGYIKPKHLTAIEQKLAAVAEIEQLEDDGKQASKLAPKKKSRRAFKKVEQHYRAPFVCLTIRLPVTRDSL